MPVEHVDIYSEGDLPVHTRKSGVLATLVEMSLLLSILFLEDDIFSKVAAAVAASLLYINGIFNAIFSNSRSALLQLSGDPTNQPTTITYKNITTHKQKGSLSQRQERLAT